MEKKEDGQEENKEIDRARNGNRKNDKDMLSKACARD